MSCSISGVIQGVPGLIVRLEDRLRFRFDLLFVSYQRLLCYSILFLLALLNLL